MKTSRILIVDDKEENLYLLRATLRGSGFEVDDAPNGAEALEKARQNPPDLIVSDLLMPVMDGYTLLNNWKADEHLKAIPFVVFTATYTDAKDELLARDLGADDFILKPMEPELFMVRIHDVLEKARQGGLPPACTPGDNRTQLTNEYSEVLVRKLEEKALQLQEANTALERDIAERRRMEKEKEELLVQLIQSQKMEAVGRLAGSVAHDFNNLLTAIFGYTSLAMMKVDEADPIHADLSMVINAATKATSVVRQLLLFSRKQPIEPVLINLNETIRNILSIIGMATGENVTIETMFDNELHTIRGDESNIEQVLMNLAVNARDAMPDGGKLIIKTENLIIDDKNSARHTGGHAGTHVCLSVTDTGTGMDKEILEHIFEPFFTTKAAGKGTGLGLSVVFGIVEQHKGWVEVFSEPGNGTVFRVFLPSFSGIQEIRKKEPESLDSFTGRGERILLVEDQKEIRDLAHEVLSTSGYAVLCASTAKEAAMLFEKEYGAFDMVLCDVMLPDKTGVVLVEELLRRKKLPVLFSSGYTVDKTNWDFIKDNNFRFLEKPYSPLNLLKNVREVLG